MKSQYNICYEHSDCIDLNKAFMTNIWCFSWQCLNEFDKLFSWLTCFPMLVNQISQILPFHGTFVKLKQQYTVYGYHHKKEGLTLANIREGNPNALIQKTNCLPFTTTVANGQVTCFCESSVLAICDKLCGCQNRTRRVLFCHSHR